jgi:hypothetical protein
LGVARAEMLDMDDSQPGKWVFNFKSIESVNGQKGGCGYLFFACLGFLLSLSTSRYTVFPLEFQFGTSYRR